MAFSVCKTVPHILFHLCGKSKIGKIVETENTIVFALDWGSYKGYKLRDI